MESTETQWFAYSRKQLTHLEACQTLLLLENSDSASPGWGPEVCISNEFPGSYSAATAAAAGGGGGSRTTLPEPSIGELHCRSRCQMYQYLFQQGL